MDRLACPRCGQARILTEVGITPRDVTFYMVHMVESHWDELVAARSFAEEFKLDRHDAWTRLP